MTAPAVTCRVAVYRFYAADDRLLYVGITDDLLRRWAEHQKSSDWFPLAVRAEWTWYDSREEAAMAETLEIRRDLPEWNHAKRGPSHRISFRSPNDLWEQFGQAASHHPNGRSGVVRDFIRWYLSKPGAELPERPQPDE